MGVKTFPQVQKLFSITHFLNIPVSAALNTDIGTIKGYVHEPRLLDMSTDQLLELWRDKKVIRVDRKFVINKKGEEVPNASLILTFKATKIPHRLPMAYEWVKVQKFRKTLLQCKKCNKMYHLTSQCHGKEICANCGQQHSGACNSRVKRCSNCKVEGHGATDPECPSLKREYEIANIRAQHKVGYARAINILNRQNKITSTFTHGNQGNGSNGNHGNGTHSNHGNRTHGDHGKSTHGNGTHGNHGSKIKKRKHSNRLTAGALNATSPKPIHNSGVGQSWIPEDGGKGKIDANYCKIQIGKGKLVQKKHITRQFNPNCLTPQQPPSFNNEQNRSYSSVVSPVINDSQIAGSSSMNVPKIVSKTN